MNTKRSRHFLAVALVAATLCADRTFAVPANRPQLSDAARQIAARLTRGLRQTVSVTQLNHHPHGPAVQPLVATDIPDSLIRFESELDCLPLLPIPPPLA